MVPILRTSERSTFAECPQKWWWAWRQGLKPRGLPKTPLWFGTNVHLALAEWYCGPGKRRGPHPAETWARISSEIVDTVKQRDPTDEELASYVDAYELGLAMLDGYVKQYGKDEHMLIIHPEQTFSLDVPWPQGDRQQVYDVDAGLLVRYVGTYDLVWRHADTGQIGMEEHKTAAAIFTGHLPLDKQAGSYWAVATRTLRKQGLITDKESLKFIEYNFLRKSMPDPRPRDSEGYCCNKPTKQDYLDTLGNNAEGPDDKPLSKMKVDELEALASEIGVTVLGKRSKVQPKPLFERHRVVRTPGEQAAQLKAIQDEAVHMQAVRDGLLPVVKHPSRDCSWKCDFYHMCLLHEAGANWKDYRSAMFRREDPYQDHRKSTEGS